MNYLQVVQDFVHTLGVLIFNRREHATCKLCHLYSNFKREMITLDDLTLIAELGRAKRDAMIPVTPSVHTLAQTGPENYVNGKKHNLPALDPIHYENFMRGQRFSSPKVRNLI